MSEPVKERGGEMRIFVEVSEEQREVDLSRPVSIGMVLDFGGEQAGAYSLERAKSLPVRAGDFVGDRRQGGSVNCEELTLYPHGNGTHTEGVGHITEERISVSDVELPPLMGAVLLSTPLRRLGDVKESYEGRWEASDLVVCAADLREAAKDIEAPGGFWRALILRVERGAEFRGPRADHSGQNPPYLTREAVDWVREKGCEHLLVELPSVDREDDGGGVPNHRRFFDAYEEPVSLASRQRTITELVDIPGELRDGLYLLSLRLPRLRTDAVPSNPVLYSFKG